MFDSYAFRTWPQIIAGATLFSLLFGVAVAMGEALFDGWMGLTRPVLAMSCVAFLGYLGVALIVRFEDGPDG